MLDPMILAEGALLFGDTGLAFLGVAVGTSLVVIGAAKSISHIAGNAVESIARQPEAGGRIFTTMIISAALIEGFTFFALIVCIMTTLRLGDYIGTLTP